MNINKNNFIISTATKPHRRNKNQDLGLMPTSNRVSHIFIEKINNCSIKIYKLPEVCE